MKVSVCMAAYNGAKYIRQQMESIWEQSRKPDEVILCDDGSTDGTVRIIEDFIEEKALQDVWKLYRNEQRKGYPDNFYYAMSLCSGDAVFLADQDDIWHRDKIGRMCRVLEKNTQVKVVCCKLSLIDAGGADIHSVMVPTHKGNMPGDPNDGLPGLRQVSIDDVFYKCEWPGMVMAYRREWYQGWEKKNSRIPHDFLLCARAAEEKGFYQMDEVLACHRRHGENTGGEEHRLRRLLQKERKLKEIEDYLRILEHFAREEILRTDTGKSALERKLSSMQGRYEALQSGHLGRVLGNAGKHWRETRLKTLVCDLVIVLKCAGPAK